MAESRGWFQALIPGEPPRATAQQKGYNRYTGQYYKKKSVLEAAEKYDFYIRQAMKEVELTEGFTFPIEAPVEVCIIERPGNQRHTDDAEDAEESVNENIIPPAIKKTQTIRDIQRIDQISIFTRRR